MGALDSKGPGDDAFEELIKPHPELRLPDEGGPPVDYTLVQRMALRDENISAETRASFFRLIVAYQSWDDAYLAALLLTNQETN